MKTYLALFYGIIVEQTDPEVLFNSFSKGVSCLVSRILLSVWFAWCLVFVSGGLVRVVSAGVGLGRDRCKHNLRSG